MNFIIIIAIIVCVAVALLAFLIVLLYKYRKHKQDKEMKEKLYGNIYVKLFAQQDSKRQNQESERFEQNDETPSLCQGLVSTYNTKEQVSVSETELSNLDTSKAKRKLAITKSTSFDTEDAPIASDDNRTIDDSMSATSRLSRSSWRSLTSIASSKTRTAKVQKSAHTMSLPKVYSSREEIKNSTSFLAQDSEVDTEMQEELGEPDLVAEILLSILYSASVSSFSVTVLGIVDLPTKMESKSVYIRGIVRPKHSDFQLTRPLEGCNPQFNDSFHFDSLRLEDMVTNHLTLTVHKTSSNKLIKELFIPLGNLKIENGVTSHFKYPLTSGNRSKRIQCVPFPYFLSLNNTLHHSHSPLVKETLPLCQRSTPEKLLVHDLGQLMLLIHHQPMSRRLKVVVNKAIELPKSEISPFKSEYQVQASLYDSLLDHKIETKQTTFQTGQNPIWNDAFHFDLESDHLNDYYLELTVVEKSRYKPYDSVIGQIILGSDRTNTDAIEQWKNCSSKNQLELPKWQSILPAIIYNTV